MSDGTLYVFKPSIAERRKFRDWMTKQNTDILDYATLTAMIDAETWELDWEVQCELMKLGVLDGIYG